MLRQGKQELRKVIVTRRFERDVKKSRARGKDQRKVEQAIRLLASDSIITDETLRRKYRPHQLKGSYKPSWEIHIEADFLLIYRKYTAKETGQKMLKLEFLGTHADLFKGY